MKPAARSGRFSTRLAEFERTRDELRSYIISSMIYPALLVMVGLGSILVLMNFVVPRFAQVFQDSRMQMPLPTQIMLEASAFVQDVRLDRSSPQWLAVVAGLHAYIRTATGRLWWDTLRLRIPLLGDALRKAETSRFARAMETLVANSVPLVQSLGIAAAMLNNTKIAGSLDAVAQGVKRGEGLSRAAEENWPVPAAGGPSAERGRRNRAPGPDVRPHGGYLRSRHPCRDQTLHGAVRAV